MSHGGKQFLCKPGFVTVPVLMRLTMSLATECLHNSNLRRDRESWDRSLFAFSRIRHIKYA